MKKLLVLFICLIMILSVNVVSAQNDEPIRMVYDDWDVQSNDTGWTVTAYRGSEKNVVIPNNFEGVLVTQLAAELFRSDIFLESVSIPGNVSVIGKNAFNGCISLREVQLPFNIKTIPEGAFKGCKSLENIAFPAGLTSIGKEAFAGCTGLHNLMLTRRINTLGESAFDGCTNLNNITVQRSLATLGANVFRGTAWLERQTDEFVILGRGLLVKYNGNDTNVEVPYGTVAIANVFEGNTTIESVQLPDTVRRIMQNAFKGAVNLRSVNIPPWVTTISSGAFSGCGQLTSAELSITLTSIGANAFENCDKLTELLIPDRVKSIPANLALNSTSLTDIRIPEITTTINKNAFVGLPNAHVFVFPGSDAEKILKGYDYPYSYIQYKTGDYIYAKSLTGIQIIRYLGKETFVDIPETIEELPVTDIKTAAFQNNPFVRIVNLPESLQNIGDWAFSYMDNLEYINMPERLRRIGNYAFKGSPNLRYLYLPPRLVHVGNDFLENQSVAVCAKEKTKVEIFLMEQGFVVYNEDYCQMEDWMRADLDTYLNQISNEETSVDRQNSSKQLIQIPDGLKSLTAGLLSNAENDIVLSVPASVEEIDTNILEGRNVTIIADDGAAAEKFALENGVKFLVRVDLWTEN